MRVYKTEIDPTDTQIKLIHQHFGNVRWVYNRYVTLNLERLNDGKPIIYGFEFSKMLNNDPDKPDWLNLTSSKAIKQAIMNGEKSILNYLKKSAGRPQLKKKSRDNSFYLIGSFKVERHRIRVPKIGWLRLKEFGYIPENVKSVTISMKNNRYYISCNVDENQCQFIELNDFGIGIDFGLKNQFVTQYDVIESINCSEKVKKLEKKLKREQRVLARKYRANMTDIKYYKFGKKAGLIKSFDWIKPLSECKNIQKQQLKINKLYERLTNIRKDYNRKSIVKIVKEKPKFISIEDLDISRMLKNKNLSKAISKSQWGMSRRFLFEQCQKYGIELREIDQFYPSSQLCSNCGYKNIHLKLEDREWTCPNCHVHHDRDVNAAINICNCPHYTVLTTV